MFTKKHDPLVDSVKSVMEKNNLRRQVEEALNEELGISSRKAVPHEHLASYDVMFEEAYKCAMKEAEEAPRYKGTGTGSSMFSPKKGDFHVVNPDGRTVEVTTSEEYAKKAAEEYGKGYEVIPAEKFSNFDDYQKTVEEAKKGSKPRNDEEANDLSPRQKALAKLGTVTGHGGNPEEIDKPDLAAARKGHAHKVGLEEKLTKSMSAGDVISDFVHSKNPKFKGKSKKKRMEMALGAYYSKHPEKSKKVDENTSTIRTGANRPVKEDIDSIMEEIRANLEEKLVAVYESGDAQMFEEFVTSLTEEQIELLGLSEVAPAVYGAGMLAARAAATPIGQRAIGAGIGIGQRAVSALRSAWGTLSGSTASAAQQAATTAQQAATTAQQAARTAPTGMSRMKAGVEAQQAAQKASSAQQAATTAARQTSVARGAVGTAGLAAASSAIPTKDSNDPGGRSYDAGPDSNDPGGRSYDAGPDSNDPGGRSYDAGPAAKPAAKPAAPATKPAAPATKPAAPAATPAPTSRPAPEAPVRARTPDLDAPNRVGGAFSSRQASELGFQESTHIKESLESMIRSRYLKG